MTQKNIRKNQSDLLHRFTEQFHFGVSHDFQSADTDGYQLLLASHASQIRSYKTVKYDDVAVVSGDFDHMAEILVRLDISYTDFEGYIERAIYDERMDPDINSLKVEGLFHGENDREGVPTINTYDAVFINSGTRGLGEYVYNGVDPDSASSMIRRPKKTLRLMWREVA